MRKRRNSLLKVITPFFVIWLVLLGVDSVYNEEATDFSEKFVDRFYGLLNKLDLEKEITGDEINTVKDVAPSGIERFRVSSNDLEVDFNIGTEEVMHLSNWREWRRLEKWAEEAPVKIEPLNTQETMEKIGREFVEKIRGYFPSNLSSPVLRFTSADYLRGSWAISWRREQKGYQYPNDSVSVRINDKTGDLFMYTARLISEELVSTDVKITEAEAVRIALDNLRSVFETEEAFGQYKLPAEASSVKLEIVNPNYMFVEGRGFIGMSVATVFSYVVEFIVGNIPNIGELKVWIWVDAETGEVVGGDMSG